MTENLSDKEQVELIKKWWRDYGKALLVAIIIGLLFGFGWRSWRAHQHEQKAEASQLYQTMITLDSKHDSKGTADVAQQITAKYKSSAYASLAQLMLARIHVKAIDYAAAMQNLQWVLAHSSVKSFQQLARMRASRILLAQKKYGPALAMLKVVNDSSYSPLIYQLQGDIYQAQGKMAAAKKAYAQAKESFLGFGIENPFLQMKADQLSLQGDSKQKGI